MSKAVSVERRRILNAFGAKLVLTDSKRGTDGAIQKAKELVEKNPGKYFMPDQFSNKHNTLAHYKTTAKEIWEQTNGEVDFVIASLGTTGTIMGLAKFFKEKNPKIQIISAHPEKNHKIQGLKNLEESIIPKIYDPSLIDKTINIKTSTALETAKQLALKEGIFAGMSSGAAMHAAIQTAKKIKKGKIVVILPDRGEKYLSTELCKG